MTSEEWQRIKQVMGDALDQPDTKTRLEFLSAACDGDRALQSEIEAMLAHANDRLDIAADRLAGVPMEEGTAAAGQRLGDYELIREIGRGGMGTIYLARRADEEFEKEVAIKILKRGTDTEEVLRRFRWERQILAQLEHPNIARLIDAGTSPDGLPYFVMEYVDGVPITDFCDATKLSLPQRIELFEKVCGALQFAHQNLVVHRDLKPGNILITATGAPKLLDFGIAKLLSPGDDFLQTTIQSQQRFTPAYASPEQIRGDPVTTASDIYSLGALLYHLLTGQPPHRFSTAQPSATELYKVIVEQEPRRASEAGGASDLRGDLDNILGKTLQKEPAQRYSGVTAFADDLRRHLDGRPVRARPATLGYRASKFISRNKLGVAAAILLLATLLSGIAATSWQARKAQRRFEQVRKLAHSVIFDYHDPIASLPGSTAVRERLVKDALEYLDSLAREGASDASLLRELASAYQRIGRIQGNSYYSNLGDPTGALKSYRESLTLREKLLAAPTDDPELRHELADSHQGIGDVQYTLGDLRAGLASYESALKLREPLAASNPGEVRFALALAQLYSRFGDIYGLEGFTNLGDTSSALAYCRKAHEILEPLAAAHPDDQKLQTEFANGVTISAMFARSAGRSEEALATAQRGLELLRKMAKPDDQDSITLVLKAKSVLRYALVDSNRIDEAVGLSREMIVDLEKMSAADPKNASFQRNLSVTYNALGKDLLTAGDVAAAIDTLRKALAIAEGLLAADPNAEENKSDIAFTWQRLGQAQAVSGEHRVALANFRQALAIREPNLAADPSNARAKEDVSSIYADLGTSLAGVGDFAAGKDAFRKAIPTAEELSKQDPTHARRKARLAEAYFDAGKVYRQSALAAGSTAGEDLRQAREHFSRSLAVWHELRDRNALVPANAVKLQEAERAVADLKVAVD